MSKRTISYGSSGEDVRKLQKTLNSVGYNLQVDGIFGAKTQSAVRSYQQKNGLSVDGIVGVNTWNSLSNSTKNTGKIQATTQKTTQTTTKTSSTKITPSTTKKRPTYQKNEGVVVAENKLSEWENNKPGEYNSKYSDEIESIDNEDIE